MKRLILDFIYDTLFAWFVYTMGMICMSNIITNSENPLFWSFMWMLLLNNMISWQALDWQVK